MFTISLPRYSYEHTFDLAQFKKCYPESMITATLDISTDTVIELTRPEVTPTCLKYLEQVTNGNLYPPSSEDLTSASRYLLIPFIAVASDPLYIDFYPQFMGVDILDAGVVSMQYMGIMSFAIRNKFHRLTEYIWDLAPIKDHPQDNVHLGYIAAYYDNLSAFKKLESYLTYRSPEGEVIPESKRIISNDPGMPDGETILNGISIYQFQCLIRNHKFVGEESDYIGDNGMTIPDVVAMGSANEILQYISGSIDNHYSMLKIMILHNNLRGIEIIRPVIMNLHRALLLVIEEGTVEMFLHLALPGPEYTYPLLLKTLLPLDSFVGIIPTIIQKMSNLEVSTFVELHRVDIPFNVLQMILHEKKGQTELINELYNIYYTADNYTFMAEFRRYIPNFMWFDIVPFVSVDEFGKIMKTVWVSADIKQIYVEVGMAGREDLFDIALYYNLTRW